MAQLKSSEPPKNLTLLLSDILPPAGFTPPAPTPVIDALLYRSRVLVAQPAALEAALLHAFGLPPTAGVAPLTRLADAGSPAGQAWLRADPVHLAISRDNAQLFDSHVINPTAEEMAAIAASVNSHFVNQGIKVEFPDPARGYIATDLSNLPQSTPLWQMAGANVFDNLPLSKTRTNWRAVSNEIQMLLHEHPVNQIRAANAIPVINGLWIWGGGSVETILCASDPAVEPPRFTHVFARLALARGLAMAKGLALATLPPRFDAGLMQQSSLVVVHTATREIRAQSREIWPAEVAAIERDWVAPAAAALNAGELDALTLLIPCESVTLTIKVARNGIKAKVLSLAGALTGKKSLGDFT
ncbi:MAG: hypothetical protein ACKO15_02210 [Burkholderiales bacterium]